MVADRQSQALVLVLAEAAEEQRWHHRELEEEGALAVQLDWIVVEVMVEP